MDQEKEQPIPPTELKDKPFTHESPYGKSDPDQDSAQIGKLLADVTYPLSIENKLTEAAHTELIRNIQSMDDRGSFSRWGDPVSPLERKVETIKIFEELGKKKVQEDKNSLIQSPKMAELRARAKDLAERYQTSDMKHHSQTESYYLRESSKLWEEMQEYADFYTNHKEGHFRIESLDKPAESLAKEFLEGSDKIHEINGKNSEFSFPVPTKKEGNDRGGEELELLYDKADDTKPSYASFDTTETPYSVCSSLEELNQAYESGEKLTGAQRALLKQYGRIPLDEGEAVVPVIEAPEGAEVKPTPMWMFPYLLPDELRQKLNGKSGKDSYINMGHQVVNGVRINLREHDYGYYQFKINLDLKGLQKEEIEQVLTSYIRAQQEFPSIKSTKAR